MSAQIHPSAIVSPKAELADGVVVGPYSIIDENVIIGSGSVIRPFVHICPNTTIGEGSTIFENATIAPEPQDLSFKGETTYVKIGDRTVIRENVTIHRASGEGSTTYVGNDCLVQESVHLGHNVYVSDGVIISAKCGLAGYVHIDRGSVIGGMTGFHQFVRVGSFCMVGGASRVAQDVPPFLLVNGSDCRVYNLNVIGLRRHGFSQEQRTEIKRAYKKIYHSGLRLSDALSELEGSTSPDVLEIVQFFRSADKKRGYCPWPRKSKDNDD